MQLARLDPDQALERLRKLPTSNLEGTPYDPGAAVAVALATDHPAKAEQAFHLWKRTGIQFDHTNRYVMRLCRRLARVDPLIARRVAASQERPAERAMAWAYVALGLADTKKAGAVEAIDHAIQEIDRVRESGPGPSSSRSSKTFSRCGRPTPPSRFCRWSNEALRNGSLRSSGAAWRFILNSIRRKRKSSVSRTSDLSACCWRGTIARWLRSFTSRSMLTSARLRLARAGRRNSM